MKKYYNYLLFLFFLSILLFTNGVISGPPTKIAQIPNLSLGIDGESSIFISAYYTTFDKVVVEFYDGYFDINQSIFMYVNYSLGSGQCHFGDIQVCLYPYDNDVEIYIKSLSYNVTDRLISVEVYNVTFGTYEQDDFFINTKYSPLSDPILGKDYANLDDTLLSKGVKFLNDIFPDKDTISSQTRFGFIFVTMLIITLLLLFLAYQTVGINQVIIYLIIFFNVLIFFYFISIGYISLGILIVIVLFILILTFFKLKGGS